MKTIYEASNAIEAHMLKDYLQQEGVATLVVGEYLQGAIGDLPAGGFVRLVGDEADYARARAAIERWEATDVAEPIGPSDEDASAEAQVTPRRGSGIFVAALIGLVVGVSGSHVYYRSPSSVDGIDYDRDGVLDERWTYSPSGALLQSQIDRNLDGKVDYIVQYGPRGLIASAEADDDFNGSFETRYRFKDGNIEASEVDTDGDGFADMRSRYVHGVVRATTHVDPKTGLPVRVEHYHLGKIETAEVDTDHDGQLDKRIFYSGAAEVVRTERIELTE